jgi:hypothetical protein
MNNHQIARIIQTLLRNSGGKRSKFLIPIVILVLGYVFLQPTLNKQFGWNLPNILDQGSGRGGGGTRSVVRDASSAGEQAIMDAHDQQKSDVIVQASAKVVKVLPDDTVGSKHQKALLELPSKLTLLLAHNIDLAQRVPFREGDTIEFKGEYEYTDKGGVIHWTHHDPGKRHTDGWIKHNGQTYE